MLSIDDRINYYLGEIADAESVNQIELPYLDNPFMNDYNRYYVHDPSQVAWSENTIRTKYIIPLSKIVNSLDISDKRIVVCAGDVWLTNVEHGCVYALSKARRIDIPSTRFTLLKCFNINRHWYNVKHIDTMQFKDKIPNAVWRGTTTGKALVDSQGKISNTRTGNRFDLIDNNFGRRDDIDIGFSFIHRDRFNSKYKTKVKGVLPAREMARNKYIISAEGNDKDSGINWKLRMNSVVLMPKPTIASWLMEDTLVPGVHYVQLKDDFTDLTDKIDWCNDNQDKCEEIIHNAHVYMSQFQQHEQEKHIEESVIRTFLNNVNYNTNIS